MAYHSQWRSGVLSMIASVVLCPAVVVWTQDTFPSSKQVRAVIDQSESLPIEYRADLQLQALDTRGALLRPKLKLSILQELFVDADAAVHPYKEKDVTRNGLSLSKRMDTVYAMNLDGLTIKARVIKAMLEVDRLKARDMLTQVNLEVPRTQCSSPAVYDVSEFYNVSLDVMRRAYTPEEQSRSVQLNSLEKQIRDIQSPMQLVPLAQLLEMQGGDSDQVSRLSTLYAQILGNLVASDRELAYLVQYGGLNGAIKKLAYRNRAEPAVIVELLKSYRHFLIQSSNGLACKDISTNRIQAANDFNSLISEFSVSIGGLSPDLLKPHGTGEGMQIQEIPDAVEVSKGTVGRLVAYRTAHDIYGAPSNSAALSGLRSDIEDLLGRISAIDTRKGACEACLFQVKAELYFTLWQLAPDSETSEKTLGQIVVFLEEDHLQAADPIQWLQKFQLLLNLSRTPNSDQEHSIDKLKHNGRLLLFLPGRDASAIRPQLAQQHNALIQVYLQAEEVLAPKYVMPPY